MQNGKYKVKSEELNDAIHNAFAAYKAALITASPIIKWAGGKSQLLEKLIAIMPKNFSGTYFEPFLGGAAMYLALDAKKAVLNDFNPQLINLYKKCKDQPEALKERLRELETAHDGTKEFYDARRSAFNACLKRNEMSLESAALMLYLNKSCFNGLYRLNQKGQFNVSFGKKRKVSLFDEDNFNRVSRKLQNAKLLTGDFEKACETCRKGDLVFFDSPYYNTFDAYQKDGFSEDDHRRLKDLFDRLTRKGVYCILTNSNEDFIKNLYEGYNIEVVDVKRNINRDGSKRKGQEVIITNYDPETSEIVSGSSKDIKKGLDMDILVTENCIFSINGATKASECPLFESVFIPGITYSGMDVEEDGRLRITIIAPNISRAEQKAFLTKKLEIYSVPLKNDGRFKGFAIRGKANFEGILDPTIYDDDRIQRIDNKMPCTCYLVDSALDKIMGFDGVRLDKKVTDFMRENSLAILQEGVTSREMVQSYYEGIYPYSPKDLIKRSKLIAKSDYGEFVITDGPLTEMYTKCNLIFFEGKRYTECNLIFVEDNLPTDRKEVRI